MSQQSISAVCGVYVGGVLATVRVLVYIDPVPSLAMSTTDLALYGFLGLFWPALLVVAPIFGLGWLLARVATLGQRR